MTATRALADGRVECSHQPEAHVAWDKRGWRAWAYCRCRKAERRGKRLYATHAAAEAAATVLVHLLKAEAP